MDSFFKSFEKLSLKPQNIEPEHLETYQFILEKKRSIKNCYFEYVFRTSHHNTQEYLQSLHLKWMQIWQNLLGTGNLVLKHTFKCMDTFADLFMLWDQLCVYYQIPPKTACDMYHQILLECEITNIHLIHC